MTQIITILSPILPKVRWQAAPGLWGGIVLV